MCTNDHQALSGNKWSDILGVIDGKQLFSYRLAFSTVIRLSSPLRCFALAIVKGKGNGIEKSYKSGLSDDNLYIKESFDS